MAMQFGLNTFGDITQNADGTLLPEHEVIRNVVAEGVLADEVGIDAFGIGEHHRDDYAISAPEPVLAAIAAKTSTITLGTAVTVLSSDDPVRLYQRFATLDAISNGRSELILGRGSFTESFPLFGYSLEDYNTLFEQKLELFAELQRERPIRASDPSRPELTGRTLYPRTQRGTIPAWIGVGGTPQSVIRAASYGMPLMLAIIGGAAERFAPFADLYRRALTELGREPLPIGVHSPGHVAPSDEEARDELWPHYERYVRRIGAERGWPPPRRDEFEASAGSAGALLVGSPDTVAAKIAKTVQVLGLERIDMKYSHGRLPHEAMMRSISLYGTEVIPRVRRLLEAQDS